MKIKKIGLLITIAGAAIIFGVVSYFHEYQTLPEIAMRFVDENKIPSQKESVIIFSPHPDDEVLGVGGFIKKSIDNGANVYVVLITNGDAHRLTTMEEFKNIRPDAEDYIQSGYTRQIESEKALKILGLDEKNIIFLGYPDGGINYLYSKNWNIPYTSPYTKKDSSPYNNSFQKDAAYTGQNLENNILEILKKYNPNYVIMPNIEDINRDHNASGKFIKKAVLQYTKDGFPKPIIYSYLIHFRNFPKPKGLRPDRLLTPPNKLIEISDGWEKVTLDDSTENLKNQAINEYKSQLKSPTLKEVMESFIKKNELLSKINL